MRVRVALLGVLLCLAASLPASTLEEFDAKLEKELEAIDAEALDLWREANEARNAERHADAIRLYAAVFERVPQFDHALRRQAGVELAAGDRTTALAHGRQALELKKSSENLAFVAQALVAAEETSAAEIAEAKTLAGRAARVSDDVYEHTVAAEVAIAANDMRMLRASVERLEVLDAKSPGTHLLRTVLEGAEGNMTSARAALDRSLAAGLPESSYDEILAQIDGATPFYVRWAKPVGVAVAVWFGLFAVLIAAAAVLSHAALRAAREAPRSSDGAATGLSAGVRRAYAWVLSLCCAFYYASIPIVMLLVVALAGSLLYGIFAIGHIPIKLVVIIVAVAGVTLWGMVRSLFIRVSDEDPGMRLDLANEPKLRALLDDVAKRIGTRAVDNVYLTPGTDVAVMERGKGKKKERCLILGVAALEGFRLRPFKAVLGHEYGHFTNRDTAGGAFALAVRNSLGATAVALAEGGAAAWYNPAWLFVSGFNRVFLRISQGASRLQEVLADRWAVFAYGAEAFEQGLRHVVESSVRFDAHVGVTLKEVVDGQKPLANLYTYAPSVAGEDLTTDIADALNRKSSPYDSHPAPAERFELVNALPQRSRRLEPDDDLPTWSVFSNPDALQHAMTAQVRENVRVNYGVEILAAPAM